jgi:hypothetical protein
MDSHASAQLAFGRRVSFGGARRLGGGLAHTLLGRAAGAAPRRRSTTHPHHRKKHHRGKMPVHHRRTGVTIPNEMLKMLVFTAVVESIRGRRD